MKQIFIIKPPSAISRIPPMGLGICLVWGFISCGPTTIDQQNHRIFNPINEKNKPALKPGGRVAIIEFHPGLKTARPPMEMRLQPNQVIEELAAAGFILVNSYDFLLREYFLIFALKNHN